MEAEKGTREMIENTGGATLTVQEAIENANEMTATTNRTLVRRSAPDSQTVAGDQHRAFETCLDHS